ncbi:MAG: glycosyltransferase family 39 protein, partial [Thermoleophilia bacterium]|nr:glycosyltransferase family 39 protein [Thermoleophilia bacterium]
MALAAAVLAWQVSRTEILFADGLRYINQARQIQSGGGPSAIRQAVDHPLYPLAIVGTWLTLGSADDAEAWQFAAQVAAATAGVLLVVPLYLLARRLVGRNGAWLGVGLTYLSPIPTRVFSDTLSESTFLVFWAWGLWAALRYQRQGAVRWLVAALVFGALSYLVRPEGLLLPLALCATLIVSPLCAATRLPASRWWGGVAVLGLGAAALVGPFVAFKGGIATKPAVARILGLA